jgi:hypothetical protein
MFCTSSTGLWLKPRKNPPYHALKKTWLAAGFFVIHDSFPEEFPGWNSLLKNETGEF